MPVVAEQVVADCYDKVHLFNDVKKHRGSLQQGLIYNNNNNNNNDLVKLPGVILFDNTHFPVRQSTYPLRP